jgi:hypothetical protein
VWRLFNKREEKKEAARRTALIERGFGPSDEENGVGMQGSDGNERNGNTGKGKSVEIGMRRAGVAQNMSRVP